MALGWEKLCFARGAGYKPGAGGGGLAPGATTAKQKPLPKTPNENGSFAEPFFGDGTFLVQFGAPVINAVCRGHIDMYNFKRTGVMCSRSI